MPTTKESDLHIVDALCMMGAPPDHGFRPETANTDHEGLASLVKEGWLSRGNGRQSGVYFHTQHSLALRRRLMRSGGSALRLRENGFDRYLVLRALSSGAKTLEEIVEAIYETNDVLEVHRALEDLKIRDLVREVRRGRWPRKYYACELTRSGLSLWNVVACFKL